MHWYGSVPRNAFISTGLLTASFVFFRDRYRYWRELRAELMAELERRRQKWQPPEPKITSGYVARYARFVTSGSTGAVLKDD